MTTTQITARLDKPIAAALKAYCKSHGYIINRFIQDCIIEKLEEVADLQDLPKLRKEGTRPLHEVLKESQVEWLNTKLKLRKRLKSN